MLAGRPPTRATSPGFAFGQTDGLGYFVTQGNATVNDLQATILHLVGLDPFKHSYRYQGLNQRLIGPADTPKVRHELLV